MPYARTQKGAAYRVKLKHAIRKSGHSANSAAKTKTLESLYKQHVGKKLPKR